MIKEYKFEIDYNTKFASLTIPEIIDGDPCLSDVAKVCDELLNDKHWWMIFGNCLYSTEISIIDLNILKQISFYICDNNLIYYFIHN